MRRGRVLACANSVLAQNIVVLLARKPLIGVPPSETSRTLWLLKPVAREDLLRAQDAIVLFVVRIANSMHSSDQQVTVVEEGEGLAFPFGLLKCHFDYDYKSML